MRLFAAVPATPVLLPEGWATHGVNNFTALSGAKGAAGFAINGSTYAIVAAHGAHGVQLIDISDPSRPVAVGAATGHDVFGAPSCVEVFAIGRATYAALFGDSRAVLLDVSDPSAPVVVSVMTDTTVGGVATLSGLLRGTVFTVGESTYVIVGTTNHGIQLIDVSNPAVPALASAIDGLSIDPTDIAVALVGNTTYAVVTGSSWGGAQVLDISNPSAPVHAPVGWASGNLYGFAELDGAFGVDVFAIGSASYAIVAAASGVQLINISDPSLPRAAGWAADGANGFTALSGAREVDVFAAGGSTYAVVAADSGVQLIDISDPSQPVAVAAATDGVGGFAELHSPEDVDIITIGSALYAIAASYDDHGVQLIFLGCSDGYVWEPAVPQRCAEPNVPYARLWLK